MSFTTGRVVLFGDCDAGGAVYTPRISDFVIEAALEFLSFARAQHRIPPSDDLG